MVRREQIFRLINGGTKDRLRLDDVRNLAILYPPLDEQSAIVAYIEAERNKIDNIITRTEREIELINEYRTTLISDAVTGKIDVREAATA